MGSSTEDRAPDRMMARTAQADESKDFSRSDREGNGTHTFGDEFRNGERVALGRRRGSDEGVVHRAADNHLHEFARVGFARLDRRQSASIAKDGHSVGDAQHFVQPVGDVDHANIVGAQATAAS